MATFGGSIPGSLRRMALATLLVGGGFAAVGAGAFSTFNSSVTSSGQATNSGTVKIVLGATGSSANRLTVGAVNIVPGDTIDRSVDLSNDPTNNIALAGVTLSDSFSPGATLLSSDSVNGLQLVVSKCSIPWTEAGTAPAYTYTCTGTTSAVLGSNSSPVPVLQTNAALSNLSVLAGTGGTVDHLLVHLAFPISAGNTFQGLSTNITYTFTATQRNGSAQ
ncbi:MAG: TasA family protein [Acidimicrobiales bacterium]